MSSLPATGAATRRGRRRSIAGGPGGAQRWRRRLTVLAFLSPWLVGFSIFFGYPLVMTAYLSFFHYDLLTPPRWVGLANYRYLFGRATRRSGRRSRTRSWFIAVSVPLQVLFAFGIAVMLTRAKAGAGVFRTVFYLPALVPPVAATLGFVYLLNPATGPGEHDPRLARDRGPALVQRSRRGRSRRS